MVELRNGEEVSEPARVVVADPPWQFDDKLPGRGRGAAKHYSVSHHSTIGSLVLPPIAKDAVLFLWRVAAMQQEALDVAKAWGFTVKGEMVWIKTTSKTDWLGSPRLAFGMGRQVRYCHETCLIATRGKAPPRVRSIRSVFFAPIGKHSAKPDTFYSIIEAMHDGPYLELFARRHRIGWTCVGNELGTTLEVA